ncbi:MAG: 50S ribosomal protein L9 [Peptococcaceae bacterium]|nr:50S ribosomal protein L9 [Peptococcaceae bacterium]
MKVILKVDVKTLGKKGSVIEVAEGYGRNYLLPRGLALEASGGNVKILEQKNAAEARKKAEEIAALKELAEKLDKLDVIIATKVGEAGKLFGSVTSKEIADILEKKHGIKLDKRKIELKESIKSLGVYNLAVKLHAEVQTTLKVTIKVASD